MGIGEVGRQDVGTRGLGGTRGRTFQDDGFPDVEIEVEIRKDTGRMLKD